MRPLLKQFAPETLKRAFVYALFCATLIIAIGIIYFYRSHFLPIENTTPLYSDTTPLRQFVATPQSAITPRTNTAISGTSDMPLSRKILPATAKLTPASQTKRPVKSAPQQTFNVNKNDELNSILQTAYQAYRDDNFELAQPFYDRAIAIDATNLDALLGVAAIAQRRGEDALAVQTYQKVLTLNPRNAFAHAGMAALHDETDQESHLKLLLLEQENSAALHFALGNHYAAQTRWSEAQQAYFDAYQLEPGNADIAFNLAISLERLGQKKPASQFYLRALQLDATDRSFDHAAIAQRAQKLAE